MRSWQSVVILAGLAGVILGCPSSTAPLNPYLAYTDTYGIAGVQETAAPGTGPAGVGAGATFRQSMALTFQNANPQADLKTSFVAWVSVGSIRSATQQDALLSAGYSQLTSEVHLGTAFTLPVGTFVFGGPGTAGATPVVLAKAAGGGTANASAPVTPQSTSFQLVTPDAILVYQQPPVSCDSVAFTYSDPVTGDVLSGASTAGGGYKTLAQVDVYQCSPLRPGIFFSAVGGTQQANQYREGDPVTFTFLPGPTATGAFATVTIGATQVTVTTGGSPSP